MILYFTLVFAYIAVNYLMALFFVLLAVTLMLGALVLIAIKTAGRAIRKPNGLVP